MARVGCGTMVSQALVWLALAAAAAEGCYWNAVCPYQLFSSKTPYDTVRGDIRDYPLPANCEAVSVWSLHRHGNRNPGSGVTDGIKVVAALRDDIVHSYESGRSQLCAQDIEEFRKWQWNETLEVSQSFLTGVGYEELFGLGARLRQKYPQLLQGSPGDYYFRPTDEQRTVTSAVAFVHGLTDRTSLNLTIDNPRKADNVTRPYHVCKRYKKEVRRGRVLDDQLDSYMATAEFEAVRSAVQQRIGIDYQFTGEDIYNVYELCRFYRSWTEAKRSPWCSVFTDQDLVVLEYRDDVKHYFRNGYGFAINVKIGSLPLRDLYENFQAAIQGQGKKVVSYFTHDTMVQMTFCALGLFRDATPLQGSTRNETRLWRSSFIAAFSTNLIVVLNSCIESGVQSYRVQMFLNEKETSLCPASGCTWEEFQNIVQQFANANLDFCSLEKQEKHKMTPVPDSIAFLCAINWLFIVQILII